MRIKEGFKIREICGEYVLIPVSGAIMDKPVIITTNETGAFICECLGHNTSLTDVCERIVKEFDVPYENAERDMLNYIQILNENHLLDMSE